MLQRAMVVLASVLLAGSVPAQDFDKVEIRSERVSEGVHMLQGLGGNIGVSTGRDGILLIDDQFAPLTPKILAAVAKISDRPIRFVINTHWHFDHTGGNENLGKAEVLILAHDNVRERMLIDHFIESLDMEIPASPEKALPVVTFSDTLTFHFNDDEIHVFHVKHAHTDGDSVIRFREANALHMGDLYFNGLYPFIDVYSGGSIDGLIDAVNQTLQLADAETRIIPGHGPLSNREELVSYRDMLVRAHALVAPLVAAGNTLEEILAAKPTAELDETWGQGWTKPDAFVTSLYESLVP